jgi:signal transduction histidine kinase
VPKDDLFKFKQYLQTMEAETIRCSDIVKNLLEFARPSEPMMASVSVQDIIKESLFLVKHQIKLQNVNITETYQGNLPSIMVDRKQIQQVLLNLFINSAQAMPHGGDLNIKTYRAEDKNKYLVIEVGDTGCGIPADKVNRIFDPFFTTKSEKKGTGLGLSMVSSIIEKHNGHIDVSSEVDKGTIFKLYLPETDVTEVKEVVYD